MGLREASSDLRGQIALKKVKNLSIFRNCVKESISTRFCYLALKRPLMTLEVVRPLRPNYIKLGIELYQFDEIM